MTTHPNPALTSPQPFTSRTSRRLLSLALLTLGLSAVACAGADDTSPNALVVSIDSVGGVPHVLNSGTPVRWSLDSTVVIHDAGGEPFGRVTGVVGDWKGGVYVADAIALRVYRFAPDGSYLGSLGGKGSGPGEFRSLEGLAWVAGKLASLDAGNGRITLLSSDGEDPPVSIKWQALTGELTLEQTRPGEAYAPVAVPSAQQGRKDTKYLRLIGTGAPDTLPDYGAEVSSSAAVTCVSPGQIASFSIPFAPRPYSARAPGNGTVVGSTGAYRLALLDAAGDTVRVMSRDEPPVPVSDAEWADAEVRWTRFQEQNHGADCDVSSITRPPAMPAFRGTLFDDGGRLWVEAVTTDGYRLDVFDSTGVLVAEFPAPPRDRSVAMTVRTGRLFWTAADSLGVQTVHSARVVEQAAPPDSVASGS